MNYIETKLADELEINSIEEMKISDPKGELIETLVANGAPLKLKYPNLPLLNDWDDVELTGTIYRTISEKPGVRYEWRW